MMIELLTFTINLLSLFALILIALTLLNFIGDIYCSIRAIENRITAIWEIITRYKY